MYIKKAGSHSPKRGEIQKRTKELNKNHVEHSDSKSKCCSLEAGPGNRGRTLPWDEDISGTIRSGNYHTVSGVNANLLKDALKNIHSLEKDDTSTSKRPGFFMKRLSISPSSSHSSSSIAKHGRMRQLFGSFKSQSKSVSAESHRCHKPRFSVTKTSLSKDNEIGPSDYIQMYRERTFSDTTRLSAARKALKSKMGGHMNRSSHGVNCGADDDGDELHYLVWRDRGDTTIYKLPTTPCDMEDDDIYTSVDSCFARFFHEHICYDLIPTSSKIVVFDTRLTVKKAFNGLVINGVKAGILWDTKVQGFTGMLTVTDFIKILDKYHSSSEVNMESLENDSISMWKSTSEPQTLVKCNPENKLYHALQLLVNNKVHRLLVMDSKFGNPVHVLTYKRMLNFLYMHMHNLPEPSFLNESISSLRIGTFKNLATITFDTTLIDALKLFLEFRVSAVPILDVGNKLVGIFSKFDFSRLAYDRLYSNLDLPVGNILPVHEDFAHMHTCRPGDNLKSAIIKIVSAFVHRLIITDDDNTLVGILSLSDILKCLVLRPTPRDGDSCMETLESMEALDVHEDARDD